MSSPDRGAVSGGQEHEKSSGNTPIDSEIAGPISMKLSGIDRGNSVTVLSQKNRGWMNLDSLLMIHCFFLRVFSDREFN